MQRETSTFETPVTKAIFVINTYILGSEKRGLQSIYLNSQKGNEAETMVKAEDHGLKCVIVSINGHKEGEEVDGKPFSIVDFVLNLRSSESKFVINKINEVVKDEDYEDQKKTP